jgi:hypothetical protein
VASLTDAVALNSLRERRRDHELGSDERAGSWAKANVLRRRAEFVRLAWQEVLAWPLLAVVASPVVLLMPHWSRAFALGAILASGAWGSVLYVTVMSGAVPQQMGGTAEEWSAQELRRLHRRRWHLANGVLLKKGDIDHVVIGPGGVLVVESKYSSSGWEGGHVSEDRVNGAIGQARQNHHDLLLFLEQVAPRVAVPHELVRAVVVLWGRPHGTENVVTTRGVTVVHGPQFREWLGSVPDEGFAPEDVAAAWRKLREHTGRRDKADLERLGPPPQHPRDWLFDFGRAMGVGGAGMLAAAEAVRATGPPWFLVVGAGLASLSWVVCRLKLRRLWWFAWLSGTQAVTVLYGVAYVATWAVHIAH